MDYAKLLKHIRETLILSQTDLAKELGVSFATVNRIENNQHRPTYSTQRKIMEFCKKHKIIFGDTNYGKGY